MRRSDVIGIVWRELWVVGTLILGTLALPSPSLAQADSKPVAAAPVTFAKDVARIFQEKCEVCHRPGQIAPMSLVTYEEARPWARSIRLRVSEREMPPWHLDKTVGIQDFVNDRSLSDDQIETIVRWVNAGAPLGNPKDLPLPKRWPSDAEWQLSAKLGRPPDLIVKSKPYTVPAAGQDRWYKHIVDSGLTEDRWIKAVEQKPSLNARKVVHHASTELCQPEDPELLSKFFFLPAAVRAGVDKLLATSSNPATLDPVYAGCVHAVEWAQGKDGEIYGDNTGKLIKAGAKIGYDIHYHPSGEVTEGSLETGIWFYPKDVAPKYRAYALGMGYARNLDIPPGKVTIHTGDFVLQAPAILTIFQPHMHYRGKAQMMEAIYPDGRSEILNHASHFNNNWHLTYIYADDAAPLLPKGTTIRMTYWHDNTTANKQNPDPRQWVGNGGRTIDEMAHGNNTLVYLSQEDFDRIVEERKKKTKTNRHN